MCLRMRITRSWVMCVQKMAKFHSLTWLDYSFVSRWFWTFTTNGFYFRVIVASAFWSYLRNFTRPYSCWDQVVTHTHRHTHTDTQTDYYNPPPTLGLIIIIIITTVRERLVFLLCVIWFIGYVRPYRKHMQIHVHDYMYIVCATFHTSS